MLRSDFLKTLGLGAAGLFIPTQGLVETKQIKIYENYLKGLNYYQYKYISAKIKEGDMVSLKRDSENKHDSFAVEVYYEEHKLGYLPAYENLVLSNLLDQGVELKAFVSKKVEFEHYIRTIAIEVFAELIITKPTIITTSNLEKPATDADDRYRGWG